MRNALSAYPCFDGIRAVWFTGWEFRPRLSISYMMHAIWVLWAGPAMVASLTSNSLRSSKEQLAGIATLFEPSGQDRAGRNLGPAQPRPTACRRLFLCRGIIRHIGPVQRLSVYRRCRLI